MNYHRDKDYLANESLFRNIFIKRFNIIRSHFAEASRGRVLDIGCSNGVFLDLFKEKNWETWGVEPSENGSIAKEKGHKVIKSFFETAELPKNYFDLVVANHTLEHVDDPILFLKKVNHVLKTYGIVFIDVPNAGGLGSKVLKSRWPYLLPQEHKSQFTKNSLSKIFKQSGFEVIHFESRSGIFEYANPFLELHRKRFILDLITIPYSLIATLFSMGDSMSLVGKKISK